MIDPPFRLGAIMENVSLIVTAGLIAATKASNSILDIEYVDCGIEVSI